MCKMPLLIMTNDELQMTNENIHNISTSRRDFLKFLGFSTAVAALTGCEGAVHKTIPYVIQPESIVAGEANYYATCIAVVLTLPAYW